MSLLRTLRRCARALAAPLLLTPLLACAPHALARPSPAADQTLAPYFVTEGGSAAALPLKSTRAQVTISGTIADVVVTQVYRNEGEAPLEARYVFPASSRAAVHALRLRVGERAVDAVVREKRQAQAEYAQARREGKSAALLEQQRPNVFTMAIANVMPGDEIAVDLRYTETLLPTDGTYRFVYPTVVGPRYVGTGSPAAASTDGPGWGRVAPESSRADARPPAGGPSDRPADSARATAQPSRPAQAHPAGSAQPFFRQGSSGHATFALDVRVLSPLPIASVTSPSHPIAISGLGSTEARLKLDAAAAHANRDVVIDYRLAGATIDAGLLVQRGRSAGDENFFLLMAQPPARVPGDAVLPREYVFIVDVSGSMHGFPLDTAKALLRDLVGRLRPGDTFNVIPFAGGSSLLHPQSLPASEENIARALRFIDGQTGGGGTELLPALRRALAMPSDLGRARSFVVVTDGYVTIEKEAFDLVRRELGQANLFAFGIGSSVNRFLIEGLARAGKGEPFFVLKPLEAAAAAQRFREYAAPPGARSVRRLRKVMRSPSSDTAISSHASGPPSSGEPLAGLTSRRRLPWVRSARNRSVLLSSSPATSPSALLAKTSQRPFRDNASAGSAPVSGGAPDGSRSMRSVVPVSASNWYTPRSVGVLIGRERKATRRPFPAIAAASTWWRGPNAGSPSTRSSPQGDPNSHRSRGTSGSGGTPHSDGSATRRTSTTEPSSEMPSATSVAPGGPGSARPGSASLITRLRVSMRSAPAVRDRSRLSASTLKRACSPPREANTVSRVSGRQPMPLAPAGSAAPVARPTRRSVTLAESNTKASVRRFESPSTRCSDSDAKATREPSAEIAGTGTWKRVPKFVPPSSGRPSSSVRPSARKRR